MAAATGVSSCGSPTSLRRGTIDGRRVTDLAAHAGKTKQSMHELVGHLERHGYQRREPDPSDTRARLVSLTERGDAH